VLFVALSPPLLLPLLLFAPQAASTTINAVNIKIDNIFFISVYPLSID
jgi:hypothetical protein